MRNQNEFLDLVSRSFPQGLPWRLVTIQPLEVSLHDCLLGNMSPSELDRYSGSTVFQFQPKEYLFSRMLLPGGTCNDYGADLLTIIHSNYLYVPGIGIERNVTAESSTSGRDRKIKASVFDFYRIQQSVIETFIAGKPKIADPAGIRGAIFFREKLNEPILFGYTFGKFPIKIVLKHETFRLEANNQMLWYRNHLSKTFVVSYSCMLFMNIDLNNPTRLCRWNLPTSNCSTSESCFMMYPTNS